MGLGNIFLALHPLWYFVPVVIGLASYGVAGLDPAASAWVGSLRHAGGLSGGVVTGLPWYPGYNCPIDFHSGGSAGNPALSILLYSR